MSIPVTMYPSLFKHTCEYLTSLNTRKYIAEFEREFREKIASFDIREFNSNNCIIPTSYFITCFESAIHHTRALALEEGHPEIAATIWNPVMEGLTKDFAGLNTTVAPDHASISPINSRANTPKRSGIFGTKTARYDARKMRDFMQKSIESRSFLPYPLHCTKQQCSVCRKLFQTVPVSACDPRSCTRCGPNAFYPHIPTSVWTKNIKSSHDVGYFRSWLPKLKDGQFINPWSEPVPAGDNLTAEEQPLMVPDEVSSVAYEPRSPSIPPPQSWAEMVDVEIPLPSPHTTGRVSSRASISSVNRTAEKRRSEDSTLVSDPKVRVQETSHENESRLDTE